jgi:hypothetical protein
MAPFWITCVLVLLAVAVVLARYRERLYGACPECGRPIRTGALKCPACGMWFAGR